MHWKLMIKKHQVYFVKYHSNHKSDLYEILNLQVCWLVIDSQIKVMIHGLTRAYKAKKHTHTPKHARPCFCLVCTFECTDFYKREMKSKIYRGIFCCAELVSTSQVLEPESLGVPSARDFWLLIRHKNNSVRFRRLFQ